MWLNDVIHTCNRLFIQSTNIFLSKLHVPDTGLGMGDTGVTNTLSWTSSNNGGSGAVAQMVECLPSKY
jgi:hypothetical protein